ncbi:hypothetical protein HNQ56_002165 [Anaerotaenia torta]
MAVWNSIKKAAVGDALTGSSYGCRSSYDIILYFNSNRLRALKMARIEALVILELTPTP